MVKGRHRKGGRTTPKGTVPPPRRRSSREPSIPEFVDDIRDRLDEPSPFGLMAMASGIIEATTPRPMDSWPGHPIQRSDPTAAFESFVNSEWRETQALALAISAMHPDELLARRLRGAALGAVSAAPWMASVDDAMVTHTVRHHHVLDDGENVSISWRWPDGNEATAVIYVDHNMGTVVKDAFVIPEGGAALADLYSRIGDDDMSISPISAADARARVSEAVAKGERVLPRVETDTWPACRPMVEWIMRRLPEGGTGYERPEWSEQDRERLVAEFVASSFGAVAGLEPGRVRGLADPLIWFGCDYGSGDPLRWSTVSVEIVLSDWYTRKVFGLPDTDMARLPDVLAAFVAFAHDRDGVAVELTDATLSAVEEWSADYYDEIARADRSPVDNAVRRARTAAGLDIDDRFDDESDHDDDSHEAVDDVEFMSELSDDLEVFVIELVGGQAAYDTLDDLPLGNRPFDWSVIPADCQDLTAEALRLLDDWSVRLFDSEVRTIARTVLAGVVAADPAVFRRSSRAEPLAAGILGYLFRRLTGRFDQREVRELPWQVSTQKDLAAATGVSASTISSRSRTVANVVERADIDWSEVLHSTQRREALRTKQIVAEWRRDQS